MEPTEKVDPVVATLAPAGQVSLLFTWSGRAFAMALREKQSCVVGRLGFADVVIDDPSLSRTHARLSLADGQVLVEDLGSTNGCLVNGVRVSSTSVRDGDVVKLGAIELRICAHSSLLDETCRVSHAAFMRTLADEIARARLSGRALAVLALRSDGGAPLAQRLTSALKPFERWCSFAPSVDLMLLPEQDGPAARRWLERALGDKHDWKVGVASYPALVGTAEQLVARALEACRGARAGDIREPLEDVRASPSTPMLLSPGMLRLYDLVARAAPTTMPVLIHGETGVGKELVARAIHDQSRRKGPFRALNCATIPLGLIESTLFGYERGAFSGAERQTLGLFEQAAGGTVFLDEIGELSGQAQAALLRVLEQHCVMRVGATREVEIDVRIVAATHRDLRALVKAGTFREDLLFRLDALTLSVPPLRERREEILPLAELFLKQACERWTAPMVPLSEDAREALVESAWPGNVRQLRNVIERAVVVCRSKAIGLDDLPPDVWAGGAEDAATPGQAAQLLPPVSERDTSLSERVRAFEVAIIRQALEEAEGNQALAARLLGVPKRTLANKVQTYGLLPSRRG